MDLPGAGLAKPLVSEVMKEKTLFKRYILLFLLLISFPTLSFCQTDSKALLDKGIKAEQLGLLERAENYYREACTAAPDEAEPLLRLGILQERRSHLRDAIATLHAAVTHNDTLAEAYQHLVNCVIEDGDFDGNRCGLFQGVDELIKMVERAIELSPDNTLNYCNMALIYNHQKNYTNALHWAKRAEEKDAKLPRVTNTLGVIYYNRGNDNEALTQFRKTLANDPDNIDAYYNLGVMYTRKNNFETAITHLKKGLQRDNKSIKLYYYLGIAYLQRGDDAKAIKCYETIIGLDSVYIPAYNRLGSIYGRKGNYDEAIAYHQKAARINPKDVESYKCLGKVYTDKGDYVKALRSYQKAVAINDRDHETYCLIAQLYAKQGNSSRETASYKKAAKLGNKEAQAWMVSKGMAW